MQHSNFFFFRKNGQIIKDKWQRYHELRDKFITDFCGDSEEDLHLDLVAILYTVKNKYVSLSSSPHPIAISDDETLLSLSSISYSIPEDYTGKICKKRILSMPTRYKSMDYIVALVNFLLSPNFDDKDINEICSRSITNTGFEETTQSDGGYYQPEAITELVGNILDHKRKCRVFNPFSGLGSFARILADGCDYVGQEINYYVAEYAIYKIAFEGKINAEIEMCNSLEWWPEEKFDVILSTPPFKVKIRDLELAQGHVYIDSWLLDKAFMSLKANGEMICVLAPSILFDHENRATREKLVKANLIDTVISLPEKLWSGTSIGSIIIKLIRNRRIDAPIRLVDATSADFLISNNWSHELDVQAVCNNINSNNTNYVFYSTPQEIEDNNFDLRPAVYGYKIDVPEGHTVFKLQDLATLQTLTGAVQNSQGRCLTQSVNVDNLAFRVSPNDIEVKRIDSKTRVAIVVEPTLLLSLLNRKAVFVEADTNEPVYIRPNEWVKCEVNNNIVDLEYFVYSFYAIDEKQISLHKAGSIQGRFTKDSLENLQLCIIPTIQAQKVAVIEAKRNLLSSKAAKLGFESVLKAKEEEIARLKADYIGEVRNRKHDMKTPMTQLRNTFRLLELLSPTLPQDAAEKLNKYITRQRVAIDALSEIVSHLADEDVFAEPEDLNIEDILKAQEQETDTYRITFYKDEKALVEAGITVPVVSIGRVDFVRLVQNIIGNAVEHGFVEKGREYLLNISMSIDGDFYVIDFSNNGKPISADVTKERYGMKGVKGSDSRGSGSGGYIVKSITQHYGGDFDVFSSKFANMSFTNVIVKLPIKRVDNEQV